MAHQDELEAELTVGLQKIAPQAIGNEYFVVGTFDQKLWQHQLQNKEKETDVEKDIFNHLADFKTMLNLEVEPGGWHRN
ncbi:hypothetical protein [Microcoleus sp. N9_A1]